MLGIYAQAIGAPCENHRLSGLLHQKLYGIINVILPLSVLAGLDTSIGINAPKCNHSHPLPFWDSELGNGIPHDLSGHDHNLS